MKLDIYLVCVLQEFPQLVNLACVACTCPARTRSRNYLQKGGGVSAICGVPRSR